MQDAQAALVEPLASDVDAGLSFVRPLVLAPAESPDDGFESPEAPEELEDSEEPDPSEPLVTDGLASESLPVRLSVR